MKRQEKKPLTEQPKPQEENPATQQRKSQDEKSDTQQPYQWGFVISWGLSAFLFGLTTAHPPLALDSIDRSALRLFVGVAFAILTALTVGIYKYFKRDSDGGFGTVGGFQSADKTVFWFSAILATFFFAMSLYRKHYTGLLDAGICGLLGVGVRNGFASSRWLLAGYAFLSPIVIVLSTDSPSGALWPFLFFTVCRSILAHQKESQSGAANGIGMGNEFQAGVSKAMAATQPTKPLAPISISVEPSRLPTETLETRLYEQIAQELETGTFDKGLWTKAYAQAEGDDKQTRVLYIKIRYARLLAMENDRQESVRQEKK